MRSPAVVVDLLRGVVVALLVAIAVGCADDDATTATPADPGPDVLERITRPVDGGAVHLVRLVQRGDQYAFDPDAIEAASGDVLRFIMTGSQPESIVFDPVEATPGATEFIRAHSLHLGVLLTETGQVYDVSFVDAPPGRYPFISQPHALHGMRGVVEIAE